MCVIISQPKGSYLDKETAADNWYINNDGGGFAYHDGTGYVIEKHMVFDDFWAAFERARSDNRDKDFLVHMRIATHGSVCIDNVHPFYSEEHDIWLAHNGILNQVNIPKGDDRSDTRVFIDELMPELPQHWYRSEFLVDMVEDWIGGSKFAILDPEGIWIINRHKGTMHNKMWFSNSYALPNGDTKKKSYKGFKVINNTGGKPARPVSGEAWGWGNGWDDGYYEAGYEAWWNENEKVLKDGEWRSLPLNSNYDAKNYFMEEREKNGFVHPIDWDKDAKQWYCRGCLDTIDDGEGECECYDAMCALCSELLGFCECPFDQRQPVGLDAYWDDNWDSKEPSTAELVLVEQEGTE